MPPPRKIFCIAVLTATALLAEPGSIASATQSPAPTAPSSPPAAQPPPPPSDLQAASLSQSGRELLFGVSTTSPVPLAELDPTPAVRSGGARYLCLLLERPGRPGGRRICLGGTKDARRRAGLELINGRGGTTRSSMIAARLKRPRPGKLVLAIEPAAAGLRPHHYRWRAIENRDGCDGCEASLPGSGLRVFRLRPVRAIGCTGGNAGLTTNGPRDRPIVALTFDDGPSEYTEGFLDVLREKQVPGTFFEIGQEMAGREATMRRILREGNEIGNHTMHHDFYPGFADLAATSARIRAATHFTPCLFRPPGGAYNSAVIAAAGEAGMRTITWDVDPQDWATPGSSAIYSRIVGAAQPGSIILMHDGGGNRSETLAALPSIIDTLRGRGYRFETVSALLGDSLIYRPYG